MQCKKMRESIAEGQKSINFVCELPKRQKSDIGGAINSTVAA